MSHHDDPDWKKPALHLGRAYGACDLDAAQSRERPAQTAGLSRQETPISISQMPPTGFEPVLQA